MSRAYNYEKAARGRASNVVVKLRKARDAAHRREDEARLARARENLLTVEQQLEKCSVT